MDALPRHAPEFSGLKGRFFAWFLTSPLRALLNLKMGKPDARFMELLQLSGDERVVDFGSGSGYHSLMMAERLSAGRVVAVDISREMLDRLRRNAQKRDLSDRIEVLEADGLDVPLEDESADRSVCVAVWHHLGDSPQRACDEMVRVLRPGGRLVAVDLEIGVGDGPIVPLKGHDQVFGRRDMRRILTEAGLEDVSAERSGRWVIGSGVKPPAA